MFEIKHFNEIRWIASPLFQKLCYDSNYSFYINRLPLISSVSHISSDDYSWSLTVTRSPLWSTNIVVFNHSDSVSTKMPTLYLSWKVTLLHCSKIWRPNESTEARSNYTRKEIRYEYDKYSNNMKYNLPYNSHIITTVRN